MESRKANEFQQRTSQFLQSHPSREERDRARSILMWLSVSQRPLRANELSYALQVGACKDDAESIARILSRPSRARDQRNASSLQKLLGKLISIRICNAGDGSKRFYIGLFDAEFPVFLEQHSKDASGRLEESIAPLAFSAAEAHTIVADVCMAVCTAIPLRPARLEEDVTSVPSSCLTLYAWAYWHKHLLFSGCSLAHRGVANSVDSMVYGICTDTLAFLLQLNDFFAGPIKLPSDENKMECAAVIRGAQQVLGRAIRLLSVIVQYENKGGYAKILHRARQTFDRTRSRSIIPAKRRAGLREAQEETRHDSDEAEDDTPPLFTIKDQTGDPLSYTKPVSRVEVLRLDKVISKSIHRLAAMGVTQKQMVQSFAEISRNMRTLCVLVVRPSMYEQLAAEGANTTSFLDMLVNAADWMEAMAGYAFWREFPHSPCNPFVITDPKDPNYEAALLVLGRLRNPHFAGSSNHPDNRELPKLGMRYRPTGVSKVQWYTAGLMHGISSYRKQSPSSTSSANSPSLPSRKSTSCTSYRGIMLKTSPYETDTKAELCFWRASFPTSVIKLLFGIISRQPPSRCSSVALRILDSSVGTDPLTILTLPDTWESLKSAFLGQGYSASLAYLVAAVLANHVRRTLMPGLGGFVWDAPLEDLRLALSNPEFLLDETLGVSWVSLFFSSLGKWVVDAAATLIITSLTNPESTDRASSYLTLNQCQLLCVVDGLNVACAVWIFSALEYNFCRIIYATTLILAPTRLLLPPNCSSDAHHTALTHILRTHATKIPLIAWQTYHTARTVIIFPLWRRGQPTLLMALFAVMGIVVAAILRWRSRLIIALEVSGLFVAAGLLLLGTAVLGVEFLHDPMGVRAGRATARRKGREARTVLPKGVEERVKKVLFSGGGGRH